MSSVDVGGDSPALTMKTRAFQRRGVGEDGILHREDQSRAALPSRVRGHGLHAIQQLTLRPHDDPIRAASLHRHSLGPSRGGIFWGWRIGLGIWQSRNAQGRKWLRIRGGRAGVIESDRVRPQRIETNRQGNGRGATQEPNPLLSRRSSVSPGAPGYRNCTF